MNKHTKRRKRRRANAVVKNGKSAVRKHMRKTGRTGGIHEKRTKSSKRYAYRSVKPNPPGPEGMNLGKPIAGRVVGRPRSRLASEQRLTAAGGLVLNSRQPDEAACERHDNE